jgi:hypothetical protein
MSCYVHACLLAQLPAVRMRHCSDTVRRGIKAFLDALLPLSKC